MTVIINYGAAAHAAQSAAENLDGGIRRDNGVIYREAELPCGTLGYVHQTVEDDGVVDRVCRCSFFSELESHHSEMLASVGNPSSYREYAEVSANGHVGCELERQQSEIAFVVDVLIAMPDFEYAVRARSDAERTASPLLSAA